MAEDNIAISENNKPNRKYGPIGQFLQRVGSNWGLSFIFTKIWAVRFRPADSFASDNLVTNISSILKSYDDINNFTKFMSASESELYYNLLNLTSESKEGVPISDFIHFILANKITIPEEKMVLQTTQSINQNDAGGLIFSRIGGGRFNEVMRSVDITFLDTNKEFTDYIIKPWIIASAHRGLIETSQLPNLKCNIEATFFAKSGPNYQPVDGEFNVFFNEPYTTDETIYTNHNVPAVKPNLVSANQPFIWEAKAKETEVKKLDFNDKAMLGIHGAKVHNDPDEPYKRKKIIFHGCLPVSLPSKGYNYSNSMGNDEVMTTVKFSYEYYTVENEVKNA